MSAVHALYDVLGGALVVLVHQCHSVQLWYAFAWSAQVAQYLQFVAVRIVVYQSALAHLERVVYVSYVLLQSLGALLDESARLLHSVVRLYHLCYVASCSYHSHQIVQLVAYWAQHHLVVHLAGHSHLRYTLVSSLYLGYVSDR